MGSKRIPGYAQKTIIAFTLVEISLKQSGKPLAKFYDCNRIITRICILGLREVTLQYMGTLGSYSISSGKSMFSAAAARLRGACLNVLSRA